MEKLSKESAIELLHSWADALEINDETDDFTAAIETLLVPVRNQRLAFDADRKVFTFRLFSPIALEKSTRESIEIRELAIKDKRGIEKYKDNEKISMVENIYAKSAGLSAAESSAIEGRDFTVISTINSVFFS